jgi:hypothetical protein
VITALWIVVIALPLGSLVVDAARRPLLARNAKARLVNRNPFMSEFSEWVADRRRGTRHARPSDRLTRVRQRAGELLIGAALASGVGCDRQPELSVPSWYDR